MISVIIPYYNPQSDAQIDSLLERAVLSAVHELDGHADFEVIVVNDGSPCPPVMAASCKDRRIRFLGRVHGCLGAARNTGIENSNGNILTFLDADDFYLQDTLWPCIKAMQEQKADLLGFGYIESHNLSGTEIIRQSVPSFSRPVDGNSWMRRHTLFGSSCMFLIDRELILSNGLRFIEDSFIEDEEFTSRLVYASRRFVHTSFKVYGYFRRGGSITTIMTREAVEEREQNTLNAISRLVEFRNSISQQSADGLDRKLSTLAIDCLRRALRRKEWKNDVEIEIAGLKSMGLFPIPLSTLPLGMKLYAGLSKCSSGLRILRLFELIVK